MGLFLILIVLASHAFARSGSSIETVSASKEWRALLHYQPTFTGVESTIDNPDFFFSKTGKTDPTAELRATVAAFEKGQPRIGTANLHPVCAFPARARLISQNLDSVWPLVKCADFDHWRDNLDLRSISLVFSTAYAGNPASMFGHTFIKLNLNTERGAGHPLLDYGAEYAANPTDDSPVEYVWKGMTGGYMGIFSIRPYYELVGSYAFSENRDLWEYELELPKEQLEYFLAHFWELFATGNADYYFLDENCSYLLLEVLDAVRPEWQLSRRVDFFVTPHQTVQLVHAQAKGGNWRFVPSQRRVFRHTYENLSSANEFESWTSAAVKPNSRAIPTSRVLGREPGPNRP